MHVRVPCICIYIYKNSWYHLTFCQNNSNIHSILSLHDRILCTFLCHVNGIHRYMLGIFIQYMHTQMTGFPKHRWRKGAATTALQGSIPSLLAELPHCTC